MEEQYQARVVAVVVTRVTIYVDPFGPQFQIGGGGDFFFLHTQSPQ